MKLKNKDFIKLCQIKQKAQKCEKKFIEFAKARNKKPKTLNINSKEYNLYQEWAKLLYDLIVSIERTSYLFDVNECKVLENYYYKDLFVPNEYLYLKENLNYSNRKKSTESHIISLKFLLKAFRDSETHSENYEVKAGYQLFFLLVDEIILLELNKLVANVLNAKLDSLTFEEKNLLVSVDRDNLLYFYNIKNQFCTPEIEKLMNILDNNTYYEHKKRFEDFKNFVPTQDKIKGDIKNKNNNLNNQ